jgi:hypothetical protein
MLSTGSIGPEKLPNHGLDHRVSCCPTPEVARSRTAIDSGFERVEDASAGVRVVANVFE